MREISNTSRSNSGSSDGIKGSDSGIDIERFASIKAANKKVRLLDILRHYGLKIEKNHQRPNWSSNIRCPLPSHKGAKERTPSFGYCFISDHFSCLGCSRAGRSVEFISLMEGIPRASVAEKILSKYGDDIPSEDCDYEDHLTPILIDGSSYIQKLVQKHKGNSATLKKIDRIIWWFDFYLMIKLPGKAVTADDLKYRISKIKELLHEFE